MKKILMCVLLVMAVVIATGYANAADYLVYDPGGDQDHIQDAMNILGFTYDVENASTFNVADIASYKALIVGWSVGGDYSGLTSSGAALATAITGNKLITGHDADYHTWAGNAAATTLFDRYVLFAGGSPGNPGILAFPEWSADPFGYLSGAWSITSTGFLTEEMITSITADGLASGLYAGLTTADLSNWHESYHGVFDAFDSSVFNLFEIGSYNGGSDVTIGTTVTPIHVPEPSTLFLLGAGLAGVGLLRKRSRK
jgi:hypothetical protein